MEEKLPLGYETTPALPSRLTLIETADSCRLIFPVHSVWFYRCGVLIQLAGPLMFFAISGFGWWLDSKATPTPGIVPYGYSLQDKFAIAAVCLAYVLWLAAAINRLVQFGRYGRVARELEISAIGLSERRKKMFGIENRLWRLEEIRSVAIKPVRSVIPGQDVSVLKIDLGRWSSIGAQLKKVDMLTKAQVFVRRLEEFRASKEKTA